MVQIVLYQGMTWLAFLILTAEIAVVCTYLMLCFENYHWWWRSFALGASPAIYLCGLSFWIAFFFQGSW